MKAIVLAAGLGKRMRPLTETLPKPLLPVGGRPLIDWQLQKLADAGVTDVVVNLFWLGEKIRAHVGDQRFGMNIVYSQEDQLLETGGGIFKALPHLGDAPFWVVNGDVWSDVDLRLHGGLEPGQFGKLLLVGNPEHNRQGDFALTETGRIRRGSSYTYSGMAILTRELFDACQPGVFPLRPLLDRALDASALGGEVIDCQWVDVGTPERLQMLDLSLGS